MSVPARMVRHLRLRAPSETAVRRTARTLEDALRTATLPDSGGRMLFVRRLALGRLAIDTPVTGVALALEGAMTRVGVEWRHGDSAGAAAAGAVWFRDPLEAHVALARRVLAGASPAAWYWPLAVPAWDRGLTRGEGVRAIALSLADRPEAPVALPTWFSVLVDAGHGAALSSALRKEDAGLLAQAAGVRLEPGESGRPAELGRSEEAVEAPNPAGGASSKARPIPSDGWDEVDWLIDAMLRMRGERDVGNRAAVFTRDPSQALPVAIVTGPTGQRSATGTADPSATASEGERHEAPRSQEVGGPQAPSRSSKSSADALAEERIDVGCGRADREGKGLGGSTASQRPEPNPTRFPTSAGGLLFLLNALERIGYGEWLASQPEWEPQFVARRALARLLGRLNVPADDPGWEMVRVPSVLRTAPRRFVAPPRWRQGLLTGSSLLLHAKTGDGGRLRDPSGRLLLGGWRGPCPRPLLVDRRQAALSALPPGELGGEVVSAWDIAVRRWIRRFASVAMADLVLRPATMTATPTHVDIHFDIAAADPRIRRAGLDIDPGWVRWFGRVVTFHYDSGGDS